LGHFSVVQGREHGSAKGPIQLVATSAAPAAQTLAKGPTEQSHLRCARAL